MLTPAYSLTATERVLPGLALDFTTASLDPRITFTRTTGASNPATYINSSGVITAATNNQPRFDYDPVTLVCKGLLIEESRTNALLNSDMLSTQSVTVTAAARTLSFYGTGQIVLSGAHSATVTGTGAYPTRTTFTFTPSAGTLTLTVTGTVQYAQLEAGAFATSYIPTTTTALTRNADVATMTGTNFSSWFNASEGSLMSLVNSAASLTIPTIVSLDGGNLNFIIHRFANGVGKSVVRSSGTVVVDMGTQSYAGTGPYQMCSSYKANDFSFATNGGNFVTDTAGTLPSPSELKIGTYGSSNTYPNGHIAKIMYWPMKLTNAEIVAFSKG